MKLKCLGSSSKGNAYIFESDRGECLILEAGVKFREYKKALNFNLRDVRACVVSHAHKDHSKSVPDFLNAGIPVLADESVFDSYGINNPNGIVAKHQHEYKFGNFFVKPFSVEHDVPTFGFLLKHPEMGKVVFITDTGMIEYSFKNLNNIIVEANFSDDIIEENVINGTIHPIHEQRVRMSHMSIQKCLDWLGAIDLSAVNNIVLVHLSEQNSDADLFRKTVENRFGKNVFIAGKNLNIDFNKTPF